jgi:hypothetical protein
VRSDKEAGQITDAESNGKGVLLYKKGQNEMGLSLSLSAYSTQQIILVTDTIKLGQSVSSDYEQ